MPLAERTRAGAAPVRAAAEEPCPARHCWVADAADGDGVRRPGLLVEWRQTTLAGSGQGWEGRVIYAARLRDDVHAPWATVEEWVPAALLTPC